MSFQKREMKKHTWSVLTRLLWARNDKKMKHSSFWIKSNWQEGQKMWAGECGNWNQKGGKKKKRKGAGDPAEANGKCEREMEGLESPSTLDRGLCSKKLSHSFPDRLLSSKGHLKRQKVSNHQWTPNWRRTLLISYFSLTFEAVKTNIFWSTPLFLSLPPQLLQGHFFKHLWLHSQQSTWGMEHPLPRNPESILHTQTRKILLPFVLLSENCSRLDNSKSAKWLCWLSIYYTSERTRFWISSIHPPVIAVLTRGAPEQAGS